MRDRRRSRPGLPEVGRRDHHDRVRSRGLCAVAAAGRVRLSIVRIPDDVDRSGRVERDRRPVRVHRRAAEALVRRERRSAGRKRADPDAEAAVAVLEDRRLDDAPVQLVVVELAERGPRPAVRERAVVSDPGRAARVPAVRGGEDLMAAAAPLDGVGAHPDLVRLAAGEPRPVPVVAVGRALVPRLPAVDRREERVVHEVDPGVVDAPARVLGEVRVAEARVDRRARRARAAEVAVAVPVRAAVRRGPDVDLVAVVRHEAEVAPRRAHDPVAIEMGRALVRGVDQGAVQGVREDLRLAAGQLLVDVDRRREGRPRDGRSASAGEQGHEREGRDQCDGRRRTARAPHTR